MKNEVLADPAAIVAANLPFLRRYARALTGDQTTGDHYVSVSGNSSSGSYELYCYVGDGWVSVYQYSWSP